MLVSEFFSGVQQKIFHFPVHIARDADFSGVGLLGGRDTPEHSTLYFGHLSQLPEDPGPSAGFVLCGASSLPDSLKGANCLLVSEEQLPAVFSLANRELTQALRMENEYAALLKMILDGKSLSAILDIAE